MEAIYKNIQILYIVVMKLWIKYLLGIALGILASFVLPQHVVEVLSDFSIHLGRYALMPLLFFSISVAVFRLHTEKKSISAGFWIIGTAIALSFLIMLTGLLMGLVIPLPRIPISTLTVSTVQQISIKELFLRLFPFNGFDSLLDGAYLLPCFIFAGFAGMGCTTDVNATRPVVTFIEAASRVCYQIMSFFTEILAVGMIAITAKWLIDFKAILKAQVYLPLLTLILLNFVLVTFVLIPVILRVFCHELHPFKVLYASLCPVLTAFFSADSNLALSIELRHGKESLGIRRRMNAVAMPFFSVFCRGGAAAVMCISFVCILHSYSSLGISVFNMIWIGITAFVLSFLLGAFPVTGPFIAITAMCTMFGRGVTDGYLLLKAAAPILCAFAAAIDAVELMAASYIVAVKTKTIEHIEIKKYI